MAWTVETLGAIVDAEIMAMPKDVQANFVWVSDLIETVGLERMREPHLKHIKGKLWELRFGGRDGIARAIYVTAIGRRVVILHAFMKKTQKTPRQALALAERRAKEIPG